MPLMQLLQKKILPILIAFGIIAVAILIVISAKNAPKPATNTNDVSRIEITLPGNVFDAKVAIPGTSVFISYPAQGFYKLGASVNSRPYSPDDTSSIGVTIGPTAAYDIEKGSEFVTLDGGSIHHLTEDESLKTFLDSFDPQSYAGEYMKSNGSFKAINGREFFVYEVTEDVTVWTAYTVVGSDVISIMLAYKPTDGLESKAAYGHNDELFQQILSHIEF